VSYCDIVEPECACRRCLPAAAKIYRLYHGIIWSIISIVYMHLI